MTDDKMQELGELLAEQMPDPDDTDNCGVVLVPDAIPKMYAAELRAVQQVEGAERAFFGHMGGGGTHIEIPLGTGDDAPYIWVTEEGGGCTLNPDAKTGFMVGWYGLLNDFTATVEDDDLIVTEGTAEALVDAVKRLVNHEATYALPQPFCTHGQCDNAQHDHTTTITPTGDMVEEPIPMMCNVCGVPTHYDYTDEAYHHDNPEAAPCFLIGMENITP